MATNSCQWPSRRIRGGHWRVLGSWTEAGQSARHGSVAGCRPRLRAADGFIARVDFAYPELRLAIEDDGLWHAERRAFLDDRRRLNRLDAAGWVVLHVTVDDLRRAEVLIARVRALRARRLAETNTR